MFQKKKESRKYMRDFIEKHVESVIKDRERNYRERNIGGG